MKLRAFCTDGEEGVVLDSNNRDTFPTHVLLYAYQRAELTRQSCLSILAWPNLKFLYVTIDGLRLDASFDEKSWREETIQTCRNLSKLDSRIRVKVWPDNPGLTNHIFRSISYVLEFTNSLITVEDDNLISVAGLNFLSSRITSLDTPQIAAGFNKCIHSKKNFPLGFRTTLFPIQWTTSLNKAMFNAIQEVWIERKVDLKVVYLRVFNLKGISNIQKLRLFFYWYKYFNSSIRSPRHTDIVVQYAVFKSGIFYEVPLEDYVEDIAFKDWRGMNVRHNPTTKNIHNPKVYAAGSGLACSVCDLLGARIEPSIIRYLYSSLSLRLAIRKKF